MMAYDPNDSGAQVKGYLNGVFVTSAAKRSTDFTTEGGAYGYRIIGRSPLGGSTAGNNNSEADDIRIYNRTLTPEEINAIYQFGNNSQYPSNNLVAQYTFNENNAVTALD
jgi:hypothetical protein